VEADCEDLDDQKTERCERCEFRFDAGCGRKDEAECAEQFGKADGADDPERCALNPEQTHLHEGFRGHEEFHVGGHAVEGGKSDLCDPEADVPFGVCWSECCVSKSSHFRVSCVVCKSAERVDLILVLSVS
jgi:hypothetical protein